MVSIGLVWLVKLVDHLGLVHRHAVAGSAPKS
jgi:hypothetical protein